MSSWSILKTVFGFRARNWDTSSWKDRKNLHWFETRWWIYQCINPSFSPLDRFCLLCWIVSKPVYACFLLPWSRWWFDTCFFFQFDEYFQNGLKKETNWDAGILSWGNQPPNTGMSIRKAVKMKVSLLSHEVSCLHTITPASSPFWETQNTQSSLPSEGSLLRLAWALAVINEAATMGNSDIFPWWWHHPLLRICTLLCQYMLPAYTNSDDS